mmetsp:Transcript_16873/g.24587  ORF Transcript_16873/g.24587 Transcript_16873/m.24587 type:complete len:235 (-) Transcript_16873:2-706(-)
MVLFLSQARKPGITPFPHSKINQLESKNLTEEGLVEDKSLYRSSSDSEHGQTAVLDFLLLRLHDFLSTLSLQESSVPADITRLTSIVVLVEVRKLNNSNGSENLKIDSHSYAGYSTEGVGVLVGLTREVEVFLGDQSYDGKHGNTSVLELGPTGVSEVLLDLRKSHGVESYISSHDSLKLFRTGEEGQGLGHLCVEGNGGGASIHRSRSESGGRADEGGEKNGTDHGEDLNLQN